MRVHDALYLVSELLTCANARGLLAHACDGCRQISDVFPRPGEQPVSYHQGGPFSDTESMNFVCKMPDGNYQTFRFTCEEV